MSILLGALLFGAAPTAAADPDDGNDREALVALYNATNGPNWNNNTNWLSDRPLGEWHGVSTDASGRVTRILLEFNQLSGALPSEVGILTSLTDLDLAYNDIRDISGLAGLTNLTVLDLTEIKGSQTSGAEQRSPLDLSPLAGLTSLIQLNLNYNKISDLSPLASLTNLKSLNLGAVHIRWDESDTSTLDLSPLADLTDLTDLDLPYNNVTDISPLASLINLTRLDIRSNHISDISPLAGLTELAYLNAQENEIANVSPLSGLTALRELVLSNNLISDIWPLVENAGLGRGDVVDVRTNPLNAESTSTHIPALLARGVDVSFDDVIVFTEPQVFNDNVLVMPVTENLAAGNLPRKDYASRFYERFNDEFDFLIFVPNLASGQHDPGVNVASYYLSVKNDVLGIGESTYANNDKWGSADRLQGVIDFGSYSIHYDRGFSILADGPTLHELMHRWANSVVPSTDPGGVHWGFSSANGNMGGFDIADLMHHGGNRYSAGNFTLAGAVDNIKPYSPIELYLAGFLPPEDVPDLWVAEDGEWLIDEAGNPVLTEDRHRIFTASQVKTYTIEDIIAEHGARVPDVSQAQKDFRAAVILLVDENHPATRESLETLSADVSWFSHAGDDETHRYNFYEATGGRGTITMGGLSAFLKDSSSHTPSGSVASDRAALVALYNATDGTNWHNNTNWLSDEPLGNWYGVTTDVNGRVSRLQLAENQLSGELPPELGDLSNLTYLTIYNNNQLSGEIPPELGSLSNLTMLELGGGSQLSGEIPSELGSLSKLTRLKLDYNKLTGNIPPELGSLSDLRVLALGGNQLSGSIPSELGSLSNLTWLGLELNELSGEIPSEFGNLSNLTSLYLQGAGQLSGSIPSELGNLSNLRDLYLAGNRHLVACLPEEARVLRATVPLEWTDINLLADCTGMEVVLTTNEDPLIYNENVFVLPVAEDLTAGQLPLGDYAARFYEYFHDDFDFLIFASNLSLFNHNPWEPTWWKFEYYGTYHGVMNDVQGIGVGMYSRNREWGSEDALQGTIHLSYSGAFSIGPALHELMHQWGNFIVPTGFGSHWGFSSANGQLGGFDIANLVDHGDGRYSVGSNDHAPYGWRAHIKPYSPIELYLAGLIPPEEVPDLWVAEDVEWLDEYTDDGDQIFTASKVRTYTIEDIIAEHGERVPDSSQSQKDFRAAAILLIDEDHPAVKWQLDKVSGHVSSFSLAGADEFDDTYNFYEATGGRATITMGGLSAFLKDSSSHTPSGSVALDRAALVALYHATDGPNWDTNTNWLSDEPLGDWHGVTTDTEGRVATLDLTENRLSGRMPNQLGDLSALGELRLGNNDLSGTIPPELGSLSALTRLDLENNDLSGAIPSQLGGMSDLRVLLLGDNNLSGHVPAQLGNLGELSYLRIRNNDLTGPIPPELGRLENLTHLYANKNDFVGSIPWELGSMSNLRYLFLNDNDLSGSIPAALGKLDELAYLWLNHNDLTGSIPAELGDLPNLVRLYINHNNLSGGIPRELGGLGKLELLYVHRNNLSGAIPRELGGLANLKRLYAYDNDLSGAIPMELASLANLERLHIAENDLSGELPQELGNLTNLVGLVLGDNDLDGEIPEELGRLAKLQTLYLHGNELSGEIPEELGELSALTDLWLNHNYLSGQIPETLNNLTLDRLWLHKNSFTGCVPYNLTLTREYKVDSGLPACSSPTLTPTWVFAGDISEEHQTTLRDEMEAVRTWFSDQHGVEATDFTVLVGTTAEVLAPEFRDVAGYDLLGGYVPPGYSGPSRLLPDPFVTTADDGRPVMVFIYGSNPFDKLQNAIAHEYFHVLQHQLLAPRYQLSEVEPYWLVEGTAMYADHAYSQSRPDRRPFLGDRFTPYKDLADAINLEGIITPRYLENIATGSTFRDGYTVHPIYIYSIAFAGAHYLVEEAGEGSIVEFWKLLQLRPTWQQAFEEAFGMGIEEFYDSFEEWLPDQLPSSYVQLSVWLHWPGKETMSREVLGPLVLATNVNPDDYERPPSGLRWGGTTNGAHTITSTAGESWTGKLSLTFDTDECTRHLLGWYKDGELTDERTEATVVEFSGEPQSLDWTIPARPDTLPRLQEIRLGHCN